MPNTNASLDVRDHPSNGADGYTDTTASNNAVYSYRYSGGSDGAGGLRAQVGQGAATLNLRLDADPRYTIDDVSFDDPEDQLSWRGEAPRNGVVTDKATEEERGHYYVQVMDAVADCTIPCDPMVINERVGH
jgi:hypothetical protein